ncbi:tRNA adenosine(34) deaminase TadA [Saxibacter everestensis]|uniref:tRNA-specific adenosine deaminase n=1 Tax=Saxibacter everestensis TaxID=2909229 RepID=A0ABY8QQ72_9MICO|nr:tRNA adenosine(34) deaminase TadA [Brevibacteriaceae bacterium ZFBP1038]
MRAALEQAALTEAAGDVPVGAVVVSAEGAIIGQGHNQREELHDPTAHAEVIALREASAAVGSWRLDGCTLVVTLEPCLMCAGAAMLARVERIVLGTWDEKAGAAGSVWDVVRDRRSNHTIEIIPGVLEEECGAILRDFFTARR